MDFLFRFVIEIVIIALAVFTIWAILIRARNSRILKMRDASLTCEELEDHARKTAMEHSVATRQKVISWPILKMNDNYNYILSIYRNLNNDIYDKRDIPPASEWLQDNFHVIEEQVKSIRRDLDKKGYSQLPVLKSGPLKGYARVFAVAIELVAHTDGQIDEKTVVNYLKAYQSQSILFDREIWAVPVMIRIALIEKIRVLCENIDYTRSKWHRADEIIDDWLADEGKDSENMSVLVKSCSKSIDAIDSSFLEHLFHRLRRSYRNYSHVLSAIDDNLARHGTNLENIIQKEHNLQSVTTISMGNCITSLKYVSVHDWVDLFESASYVEQILKQDPDGTYPLMDFSSRNYYRSRVKDIAAVYGVSELHIAREAIELAKNALLMNSDIPDKRAFHVGYYLIGKGVQILQERQGDVKNILKKSAGIIEKNSAILYLCTIGLITLFLTAITVLYSFYASFGHYSLIFIVVGIAALIPSSEIAVSLVNRIVCKDQKPAVFPSFELKDGIPDDLGTIVVIPALLPDEARTKALLERLESHYLSNRENNLYFTLLGTFNDADRCCMPGDEKITGTAISSVRELNRKYAKDNKDIFFFIGRTREYNESYKKWMGWERKRGALMEFNDIILGSRDTSYIVTSFDSLPFLKIRYIITLDADTILPAGMAKKMIGTMTHPLHRPIIDSKKGIVTEGYGIMQPRILFDIESSSKSLFSRIFTEQEGIDPYSGAISDVYQDLFGEGSFTGKGIYDLRVFQSVLKNAIPENAVLSHDLLEGSYARTALVTDLKLIDAYPTKYNSFALRLHRWIRGDWQLIPLLYRKIFNVSHQQVKNPLSLISRWKIFDNLRRSLIPPALMIMLILGFSVFPGSIFFWLGYFLAVIAFPFIMKIVGYLLSGPFGTGGTKRYIPIYFGLKAVFFQALLSFVFLPYQAFLAVDAVIVTLVRVLISKKNMLEWTTSADAEKGLNNSLHSYISRMSCSVPEALLIVIPAFISNTWPAIATGIILLAIWGISPWIAFLISREQEVANHKFSREDSDELRRIARKTWRYFEDFSNFKSNNLPPDNYQEAPPTGIAYRTSPTNIGLGLLAVLAARDMGYIGTSEMIGLISNTVSTIEKMEKWNGHLYNWYDTRTLKILRPAYISTVDSGNFICYLITMVQGLYGYLASPLVELKCIDGFMDTFGVAGADNSEAYDAMEFFRKAENAKDMNLFEWNEFLNVLLSDGKLSNIKKPYWKAKIEHMAKMYKKELSGFMPWIEVLENIPQALTEESSCHDYVKRLKDIAGRLGNSVPIQDMPSFYRTVKTDIGRLMEESDISLDAAKGNSDFLALSSNVMHAIDASIEYTLEYIDRYNHLIGRIQALSAAASFPALFDAKKKLFSIGYNIEEQKLSNSYYDLLASEARQTSYIAIARGEIPVGHWARMGRMLTIVDRYKGLVSWNGTMFEYLMPLLIMKSYKNTLLDETYSFVIKSQKKYARQRNIPWGNSESCFYSMDANLEYHYKAIGVPWLGLKRGLVEDAVAAPYATFLALSVDPEGAFQNIRRLKADGLDGPYGFYEAVDYTPDRIPFGSKRAIVKSFMAHHQGMSLIALDNSLNSDIMQKRFHSDPEVNASRLLLQEKVPADIIFTKETKEKIMLFKAPVMRQTSPFRRFTMPDPVLPKAHILSNGDYSVMITDKGTGYSKNKTAAVTRWREDSILDKYGIFFYLKNTDTNMVWSAAYAPLNVLPDKYEVVFSADKVKFTRMDGNVETATEIVVASGDNAELRRITLKNHGNLPCILEVTSYFEIVLAPLAADIAHPAFSNLFIKTGFLPDKKCIIANRRPRSESDKSLWIANTAVVEGETIGEVQYETDRMLFLGRGHDTTAPTVITNNKPLSNTVGTVLDPVMSMKFKVKIGPGKTARLSYIFIVSESDEALLELTDKYASPESVEGAFALALTRSQVEMGYLNMEASEIELCQDILSSIIFISPMRKIYNEFIAKNRKGQSSLWQYGISGDHPIVLAVLKKADEVAMLYDILKAQEYWRLKDLKVDLVILSDEENSYTRPLLDLISDNVISGRRRGISGRPVDVFILDGKSIPVMDLNLLYAVARITFCGSGGTIAEQSKIVMSSQLPGLKEFTGKVEEYGMQTMAEPELVFFNGLGGFNQNGSEYVILLGKGRITPAPWINVISNPGFGFIASECGSGYAWFGNSHENRLLPWSNDPVSDSPGEVLYLGDGDTGEVWTVTSLPVREDEAYIVRHGFGYSVFEHQSHGIEQSMVQFVPLDESVKISIISLKNSSNKARDLILTYYAKPVLGVSDQYSAMHVKTGIGESVALLMENPYNEDFAGTICFMDVSMKEYSVTCDRKEFFGTGDISFPEALKRERLSGAVGTCYDPCAAIQVNIAIEQNECIDIVFLFGAGKDMQEIDNLANKYKNIEQAQESLKEIKKFWKDRLGAVQVNTPDLSMNFMLNGWLMYQVISCRLWARSGFYQSGGAFGFRDQLQDCMAFMHIWPEASRSQILLHARHQFVEGDVQHWWHEPSGKGTRTRISDDLLWLPYVTSEYIRITGDYEILDAELPFLKGELLKEFVDEKYGMPVDSGVSSSLYDHCVRAIEKGLAFGSHGIPLIGSGDWNDGMNTVGNRGFGESVWLGWFMNSVLVKFSAVCKEKGDEERAAKYIEISVKIAEAIEKTAWDGNWYIRAFFDNGMPLGSILNSECKIDSIAQTWAVLSDVGNTERALRAMHSVEDYLVDKDDGLIKLLAPPFDHGDTEPGYIKGYLPGIRENGGQYSHAAAWVIMALAKQGEGDKAGEFFELINPINHARTHRECFKYKAEPYVITADVYSVHPHTGRGGWTWYTGSAGWMYRAGLENILGFQKNGDTVIIDPCIPKKWVEYSITYKYLDTSYDIKVKNTEGVSKGVKMLTIDSKTSAGNVINLVNDRLQHHVEVIMGYASEGMAFGGKRS